MTDSFITQAEALIESTKTRLETGRNPSGRQVYIADDEDRMRDLAAALRSLLGEYKRLTTEQEWEYGVRALFDDGEEYESWGCASRGDAEREALKLQGREDRRPPSDHPVTYSVWKRRMMRDREWVPVEGEDQ